MHFDNEAPTQESVRLSPAGVIDHPEFVDGLGEYSCKIWVSAGLLIETLGVRTRLRSAFVVILQRLIRSLSLVISCSRTQCDTLRSDRRRADCKRLHRIRHVQFDSSSHRYDLPW
jgi:hypothetical protein